MANYINMVMLCGNLGHDPETKTLDNNRKVCQASIATTESWKDKQGEWQNKTYWHKIVAWQGAATALEKAKKGEKIIVTGKITNRSYQDSNGATKYITEIVADSIVLCSSSESGTNSSTPADNGHIGDDDLPF